MRTLAVLPVKGFATAKARLAARLEPGERAMLAESMLGDVLVALAGARELEGVVVVTAEPRAAAVAGAAGAAVIHDAEQAGQSPAADLGIAEALRRGCERALLVPGDTPLLQAGDVADLLRRAGEASPSVTIVPDRHGTGTNALLLTPPDAIAPGFGPDSRERHAAAAERAGVDFVLEPVPSLGHDVDTPEDLDALAELLRHADPTTAPRTRAAAALSLPTRD